MALLVLFVLISPLVTRRIYASDEIQYFSYLHSLFFDHDLEFGNGWQGPSNNYRKIEKLEKEIEEKRK